MFFNKLLAFSIFIVLLSAKAVRYDCTVLVCGMDRSTRNDRKVRSFLIFLFIIFNNVVFRFGHLSWNRRPFIFVSFSPGSRVPEKKVMTPR